MIKWGGEERQGPDKLFIIISDSSHPIPDKCSCGLYLWEPWKVFMPRGDVIDGGFNGEDFGVTVMCGLKCREAGNPERS